MAGGPATPVLFQVSAVLSYNELGGSLATNLVDLLRRSLGATFELEPASLEGCLGLTALMGLQGLFSKARLLLGLL